MTSRATPATIRASAVAAMPPTATPVTGRPPGLALTEVPGTDSDSETPGDGVPELLADGDGDGDGEFGVPVPLQVWLRLNVAPALTSVTSAMPPVNVQPTSVKT